tara:strand:+ start:740 stop:1150 length:411 start_codon:yes stop_codon:yes gene_type:complete
MHIDLTDREMQLLIDCIGTNIETVKRRHVADAMVAELLTELADLDMDLREALHRQDDGWGDADDPDLLMDPVDFAVKHDAETQMFNAGIDAREKIKATTASRAQDRRTFNVKRNRDSRLSETQTHDVWDDSDPRNW